MDPYLRLAVEAAPYLLAGLMVFILVFGSLVHWIVGEIDYYQIRKEVEKYERSK